jgi:class 3 adenylate cyclase
MKTCPRCGEQNSERARFCQACAAPLEEQPAAREERKVVTVLFCDLVGSTARAEGSDPEDVRALLSAYHERVRRELERFGGTVEKFIGDAVMALFGAPSAHEDDPERAVRAALAIREWAQEEGDLQVRIGITTGEALVTLGARPEAGEGMASGDVVNTAARLQAAASVDGILVDETTYRATSHAIDCQKRDPIAAKGKAERVPVWEVREARARLGVDVLRTSRTALVGRARELDLLGAALARVREERAPQLVTIVGAPGIGKSRLIYELLQLVEADPELVYWRQGRCLSYGDGVSYWALGEVVKAHAGILETDSTEAAAEKLRVVVSELIPEDSDARWVEDHLRPLAGLEAEAKLSGDRRQEAFAAWRRFLEELAERNTCVLVLEDLQWADEGLLDFVDHLVEWSEGVPLLVVATARPELLGRRPGWGGGKANATTISLAPLSDDEVALLLAVLLETPVMAAEMQRALLIRAGGNPLYAEQFARMLQERRENGELAMPETVQGIIAARLDALAGEEKELLHDAAVVGKVFWTGSLAAIGGKPPQSIEELLHALGRRELVRRERRPSVAGEGEYVFQHVLVRDVAYGQIPRARRAEKHLAAAAWLESLAPDRSEDRAELLAHHYLSALEYARASGGVDPDVSERARLALREAGDRAFGLNAFAAARQYYGSAVDLWPADDAARPGVLFRRAEAAVHLEPAEATDLLEEAREALVAADDLDRAAEADAFLVQAWRARGQRDRAFEYLDHGRALVAEAAPSIGKARLFTELARYLMLSADSEEAIRVAQEALTMAEELGLEELRAHNLITIGTARSGTGAYEEGIREIEQGIASALAANAPGAITRGYTNLGSVLSWEGDLRRAGELLHEAIQQERRFGLRGRFLLGNEIDDDLITGNWDRCLERANEFIAECETGETHTLESAVRGARGLIRFARGDVQGALADARAGLAAARETKQPQAVLPALGLCARLQVFSGALEEAQALAEELLALPDIAEPTVLIHLAWVAGALGRETETRVAVLDRASHHTRWHDAAEAILVGDYPRAAELLDEIGDLPETAYARLRAAEALLEQGRRAEADDQLEKSLEFWRSVGATRYVQEGEGLLAESA